MLAIFKHELRALFHSFTAYVFGAFLLVVVGLGALAYNLQAAVSNFEYVLSFAGIIFVVIVPLLTMRVIAEERRQKTDQLLYALPISTTDVVLGKYAALLVVFLVPLAVIAVYPLIFSCFGEVYLPVSYGSIFAYFVMGAALIAVGVFLSSLTENQGMAAGLGVAVILFNYYSVSLDNLESLLADYGVTTVDGVVVEASTGHYTAQPYILLPDMQQDGITDALIQENYYPNMPIAQGLVVSEDAENVVEVLTTSDEAFSKAAGYDLTTYEKEDGDTDGPFALAVSIACENEGQIVWFSSAAYLEDMYNALSSSANVDMTMNAVSELIGEREAMAIRSKSLNYNYLSISSSTATLLKVLMVGGFPLAYLGIGTAVILKRRRAQHEAD